MARKNSSDNLFGFPGLFDDEIFEPRENSGTPAPGALHGANEIISGGIHLHQQGNLHPLGPVVVKPVPNKITFLSFGSGSSGNCAYIGDSTAGFLIDAGVDAKTVLDGLAANNIPISNIKGICITHDHSDHMRFAYTLVRKHKHINIFCTPRAMNGILRRHNVSRRIKDYHTPIYKEIPFTIGNFTITAFEVMHDGSDNAGFFVQHDDRGFAIATDLGCISDRADYYMRQADYLMIESNYDLHMLMFGSYPEYLKSRIRNVNGHLDNKVTAEYLAKIYSPRLRYVFLCHLSRDNNTPEEAVGATRRALEEIGLKVGAGRNTPEDNEADIQVIALPRFDCSQLFSLRP